jgi:peptide/nickel transport system permease protein
MLARYIFRRLLTVIPILLLASVGVFVMQAFLPGDLAVTLAGQDASKAEIASIRKTLNLNEPLWHRYITWLWHLVHGNLGTSYFTRGKVTTMIGSAWLVTVSLVLGALLVAAILSPIIALVAARFEGGWFDQLTTVVASASIAIPDFVLGMLLLLILAVKLRAFPIVGYVSPSRSFGGWLDHLALPVACLAVPVTAGVTRQLRYGLAEVLHQDYVRTAYAKGLRTASVLGRHALPAASPPAVAVMGVYVARLLGGAVIVEQVFGLPGLGQVTVSAVLNRDYAVIEGVVPLFVAIALLANLLADVVTLLLRPRTIAAGALGAA